MLKTLRSRLITVFVLFGLFALSISFLSHWGVNRQQKLEGIKNEVMEVYLLVLQDAKLIGEFFASEAESKEFLESEISDCLQRHYELSNEIKKRIDSISKMEEVEQFDIVTTLDSIHNEMYYFDISFNQIIWCLGKRGGGNYGLIKTLQESSDQLVVNYSSKSLLKMKLFEINYLYTKEYGLVDSIKKYSYLYCEEIKKEAVTQSCHTDMKGYLLTLKEIVEVDKAIGFTRSDGFKKKLEYQLKRTEAVIKNTIDKTEKTKQRLTKRLDVFLFVYVVFLVVVIVGIGVVLAIVFSSDISQLSFSMATFVRSSFTEKMNVDIKSKKGEIRELVKNVQLLQDRVVNDIHELEARVERRTEEVELQKNEIQSQKEALITQHEEVLGQRDFIARRNKLFSDSLSYAKNIQQATLPSDSRLKKVFPDSFVLYKPKEIVSGDFYWVRELECCGRKYRFFVVADCTGHGVPGAFMSLLGVSYLNDVLLKIKCPDPGVILDKLREKVIRTFQGGLKENLSDGMDITLGIVDEEAHKMFFAGANHNLCLFRDGVMTVIKGDKMPVGDYPLLETKFKTKAVDLQKGDVVYAFSDGYPDQFSELTERKYYVKRFKETLSQIHQEEMSEQKVLLENIFLNWKGSMDQTDDVLVMGIRF